MLECNSTKGQTYTVTSQVIFRKGGLREAPFRARQGEFLLVPNSFHSEGALLKPDASARFAQVRMAWHPVKA